MKPSDKLLFWQGLTCFLCYAIFAAVLGMFQFGFNTGVINTPQEVIQEFIAECWQLRYDESIDNDLKNFLWAIGVSIFAIGGMVGGFAGGYIGNKVGRCGLGLRWLNFGFGGKNLAFLYTWPFLYAKPGLDRLDRLTL